jgi:hypothetical protein
MEFFRFLEKESEVLDRGLLILGILAAMIKLFLLFALTAAGAKAVQHESNLWEFVAVIVSLFTYWFSQGFVLRRMPAVPLICCRQVWPPSRECSMVPSSATTQICESSRTHKPCR